MSLTDSRHTAEAVLKEVDAAQGLPPYLASDILEIWRPALPRDPATASGKAAVLAFNTLCAALRDGDADASFWQRAVTALETWRDEAL